MDKVKLETILNIKFQFLILEMKKKISKLTPIQVHSH